MSYYLYLALAGENKISIFAMDPETGKLQLQEDVGLGGGPGPLAVDPEQKTLYVGIRSTSEIASFSIDRPTGSLSHISSVSLQGDPCYLSTDRKGRFLLGAYYGAGKVTVHPIDADGGVRGAAVTSVSTAEHAHCIQTDATNRFAFVPHVLPSNAIFQFLFDEDTGQLTANATPRAAFEGEPGPRHFCFHPSLDVVYSSNEQGCSASAYHFDTSVGTLSAFETLSTLPTDWQGDNTCAQIWLAPSGRYLYVSNRGHDSIACFAVDMEKGGLTAIGHQLTEEVPRVFNVDPQGQYLFAGGQRSGRLASYRIDQETGVLQPLETYAVGERPMWVHIADLSG